MDRAYSLLEVKSYDEGAREIEGIATTPTPDRMRDVIEPMGAKFANPSPLLWQHDSAAPVGEVVFGKPTKAGIPFKAKIAKIDEPGRLKDRLDEAWQSVKAKLVRAVSIGFRSLEHSYIEGGGIKFSSVEILELSLVTIPANADATITSIKSIDRELRAASGHVQSTVVRAMPPGASGKSVKSTRSPKEGQKMNVAEQIKQFETTRAAKVAAMESIMAKSAEAGETLDAAQSEEYDGLKVEVDTIGKHLERLRAHEKTLMASATPVQGAKSEDPKEAREAASASRAGQVIAVEKKLPPGVAFARYAGVMAAAKGSVSDALHMAKETFPEEKHLHSVIAAHGRINRAAVDVGTTLDSDYAAPLVYAQNIAQEFIEFLRPQTIVGRIAGIRRVPFNVRVPRQLTGGSAGWVGEAAPKGVTGTTLDTVTLKYKKLATIAVISDELARFSQPSAELIIRDTLAGAIIQQMDSDFVNPANSGTADVKPASITNSVSGIPSSGNTEADVRADIQAVFAPFIAANITPANGVWIMSATTALAISLMVNNLGQPSFPGVSMTGGTLWGMPVVVSEAVGNIVILANASDIMLADDGQVTIDTSREASLQMDSAPTNPPVAATVFVSLWQMNLLGIRAERYVDWVKARPQSVQYLSGVAWGQITT